MTCGDTIRAFESRPCAGRSWCCMHRGYDVPMPTIALTPHGLPPSSQVRTRVANLRKRWLPVSRS